MKILKIDWTCHNTWKKASKNTIWCLIGCSIGDFGTIYFFQNTSIAISTTSILLLATINGLLTSILLETLILSTQMKLKAAFRTAISMSLISMISMEIAMNIVDVFLTGGAKLVWWALPFMLFSGFITPLPYNYWRLKALNKSCH